MKPPRCVVDRWAGGSLTRRPKGPFDVSWPRQLGDQDVISWLQLLFGYPVFVSRVNGSLCYLNSATFVGVAPFCCVYFCHLSPRLLSTKIRVVISSLNETFLLAYSPQSFPDDFLSAKRRWNTFSIDFALFEFEGKFKCRLVSSETIIET